VYWCVSCRIILSTGLASCPQDGDLTLKNVGEFMCMYDLWFYINCVHLFVYVGDYSHSAWKEQVILDSRYLKIGRWGDYLGLRNRQKINES
jgi:hypothetical protein